MHILHVSSTRVFNVYLFHKHEFTNIICQPARKYNQATCLVLASYGKERYYVPTQGSILVMKRVWWRHKREKYGSSSLSTFISKTKTPKLKGIDVLCIQYLISNLEMIGGRGGRAEHKQSKQTNDFWTHESFVRFENRRIIYSISVRITRSQDIRYFRKEHGTYRNFNLSFIIVSTKKR